MFLTEFLYFNLFKFLGGE